MRKICVIPRGTECRRSVLEGPSRRCGPKRVGDASLEKRGVERHTVSVNFEVDELIVPLCENAKGVFEEGHNDQEASYRR